MNQYIHDLYKGLIEVFNSYELTDKSLKEDLKKWKKDFEDFAKNFDDPVAFNNEYWGSELNVRHSNLLTKIAASSLGYFTEKSPKTEEEATFPTIKEFVEQYKVAYNEVKKAGYRKNGELAYEELFNVAKRTNDIIEGQMIIEKERLLWKIVKEDTLDIFKPILEAMDPLFYSLYKPLSLDVEVYEKRENDGELNYYLEINKIRKINESKDHLIKVGLILMIQLYVLKYVLVKEDLYYKLDKKSKDTIAKLIIQRNGLKRALKLVEDFNLTIDDLFNDESLKIWLIFNKTIDLFGKFKYINNPKNYLAIYEILTEEIIPNISIDEILLRKPKNIYYHRLNHRDEEKYIANAKEKVEGINSELAYYKYSDKLDSKSKRHVDLSIIDNINNLII